MADKLWDILNMEVRDGAIGTRGYLNQVTFESGVEFNSLFHHATGSDAVLVSTEDTNLRIYSGGSWINKDTNMPTTNARTSICSAPAVDKNYLIYTDGAGHVMKYNTVDDPTRVGATLIFSSSSNEEWDNSTHDSSDYQYGDGSQEITVGAAATVTNELNVEDAAFEHGSPDTVRNDMGAIYHSTEQIQSAFKVSLTEEVSFDKVQLSINTTSSPSASLAIELETDSGGEPSGNLVSADAYSGTHDPGNGEEVVTFTMQAGITTSSSFWVVVYKTDGTRSGGHFEWTTDTDGGYRVKHETVASAGWAVSRDDFIFGDPTDDTWEDRGTVKAWAKLVDSTSNDYIDIETSDFDTVYMWVKCSDTSDLDTTNSKLQFIDEDGPTTAAVSFSDMGFDTDADGEWQLLFATKTAFSNYTTIEWARIIQCQVVAVSSSTGYTLNVDTCYELATRIDASSGSQSRPMKARYCAMSPVGDRLLLANTESGISNSGPNAIYYSNSYAIDAFDVNNFILLPEPVLGICTAGGVVHAFSKNRRWVLTPNYAAQDYVTNNFEFKVDEAMGSGTEAHFSCVEGNIDGRTGVFYMSRDGVWFASGLEAQKISTGVPVFSAKSDSGAKWYTDTANPTYWGNAHGAFVDGKYYLAYTDQTTSQESNNVILVYDTETKTWTRFKTDASLIPKVMARGQAIDDRPSLLIGTTGGDCVELEPQRGQATDEDGATPTTTAISAYVQTPYIGLDTGRDLSFNALFILVKSDTTDTINLRTTVYLLEDYDDTSDYRQHEEDVATGVFTVDTSITPTAHTWKRVRIDLSNSTTYARGRAISIKVQDTNNTAIDLLFEKIVADHGNKEDF
jgi:hypothetical protein